MNKAKVTALVVMTAVLAFGAPQKTDWVKYTSAEGRYSVLFPNQPTLNTQEAATSTDEKVTQYYALSSDADAAFVVGYFDKSGKSYSFDKARDGMIAKIKGTLLAEKAISLGGYPGREVKVAAKGAGETEFIALARYYEVGERIYVVEVVFLKASESAFTEKATKFFDSFGVVKPR